jgi:hypothetical protein
MVKMAIWFLNCGKEKENKSNDNKILDFEIDSNYIYNAFLKKGIDLDATDLHWWHFMGHFSELPECFLTRLLYLRSRRSKGILTKDERKECANIGWDVILINNNLVLLEDEPEWLC